MSLQELRTIPSVGKAVARDIMSLGIHTIAGLKHKDPEKLYAKLCKLQQKQIDRCMLYTLRCAVYYASNTYHDPFLLKWWNWKDIKKHGR